MLRPASGLIAAAATALATPAGDNVVINEVYGGGGNSDSTYTHDFVELYNSTDAPIFLDGWTVEYYSATGTTAASTTTLAGTVAPGDFYLIQQARGNGGTDALPTPDAIGTAAMSGTNGKVVFKDAAGNTVDLVADARIWNINADEPIVYEYSRRNYNVVDFHEDNYFRSSDHDPMKVGFNLTDNLTDAETPTAPKSSGRPAHSSEQGRPKHVGR